MVLPQVPTSAFLRMGVRSDSGFRLLSKTQEEMEEEEINLINALNPGDSGLATKGPAPSPPIPPATPGIDPRDATACLPSNRPPPWKKTCPVHTLWPGSLPTPSKAAPPEAVPVGRAKSGRPARQLLLGPDSILHFSPLHWKNPNPSYGGDTQRTAGLWPPLEPLTLQTGQTAGSP